MSVSVLEEPQAPQRSGSKRAITTLSVMGERSSGTNLAQKLLTRNFGLVEDQLNGWKHAPGTSLLSVSTDHLVIICVRNAISWTQSMYAKPWHALEMVEDGFSAFLRRPWASTIDRPPAFALDNRPAWRNQPLLADRHPVTGALYANLLEMRTVKAQSYLALRQEGVNFAILRLEDLQADAARVLDRLAEVFDLQKPAQYEMIAEPQGGGFRTLGRDARREEARAMDAEDRAFILSQLDPEVEAALGYRYPGA